MRRAQCTVACAVLVLMSSLKLVQMTPTSVEYPPTRSDPDSSVDLGHTKVPDPYLWLEGDVRTDKEVADWVQKQHVFGNFILSQVGGARRQEFEARLREVLDSARIGDVRSGGRRWFVNRNAGLQDFSVWYWTEDMGLMEILQGAQDTQLWAVDEISDGATFAVKVADETHFTQKRLKVLFDPNKTSEDKSVELMQINISPDGNLVLYQMGEKESVWRTMFVKRYNPQSGQFENDPNHVVEGLRSTSINILCDNSGVYYTRWDKPAEGRARRVDFVNGRVVFYSFADKKEVEIFRDAENSSYTLSAIVDSLERYLVITQRSDAGQTRIFIQDRLAGLSSPVYPVYNDFAAFRRIIRVLGNKLYVVTDEGAPRMRIVSKVISAENLLGRSEQVEVIPQSNDPGRTLIDAWLLGDGTFVLHNCLHVRDEIQIVSGMTGKLISNFTLPGIGHMEFLYGAEFIQGSLYYTFSSWNMKKVIYQYDAWTAQHKKVYEPPSPFESDGFVVEQVFIPSKDGSVKIPAFIAHKKNIKRDGSNPTLLYGYGAFSCLLLPHFKAYVLPWLEAGGVYVQANIRGGGEYGRDWHQSAVKQHRQNAFDDFIAVAEHLIAQKYTSAKHLGIEGSDDGGLLVAACMTQRPDLFSAVSVQRGIMDMMRYHKFGNGPLWTDEYGNAEKPEDYGFLIKYSPYHKVLREGPRRYPATLIMAADYDDSADSSHSFKFLAALQQAQSEITNPIIARLKLKSEQGASKSGHGDLESEHGALAKYIAADVDFLSFFFHFLSSAKDASHVNNKTVRRYGLRESAQAENRVLARVKYPIKVT